MITAKHIYLQIIPSTQIFSSYQSFLKTMISQDKKETLSKKVYIKFKSDQSFHTQLQELNALNNKYNTLLNLL